MVVEDLATAVLPLPVVPAHVSQVTGVFKNAQGLKLMSWRWQLKKAAAVKGVVYLAHGYGGHSQFEWFLPSTPGARHDVYAGSLLATLVEAGYCCLAVDHQSMGRSEGLQGLRCYFDQFDDLALEASGYVRTVLDADAALRKAPVFILGISMGGCTAVRMALLASPTFYAGLVLLAPMLSLELVQKQPVGPCCINRHLKPFASLLSYVAPTLQIAAPARNEIYPETQKEIDEDPLTYTASARSRVGEQFMTVTSDLLAGGLEEVTVPFLTMHADKDTFTDPYGSEVIYDVAQAMDKTYLRVGRGLDIDEDMWHGLSFEPGRETVFKALLTWVDKRAP